jgi:hypothetical protein
MPASGDAMFYNFILTVGLQTVVPFMPGLTAHFFTAPSGQKEIDKVIKTSNSVIKKQMQEAGDDIYILCLFATFII